MDEERIVLDRRDTPRGEIQLQQRRAPDGSAALEIIVNGVFLMASYNQASERALASLALAAHGAQRRVLIGGLGLGHTLEAALSCEGVARVDVVEVEETVIGWFRHYLGGQGRCLDDPRVRLVNADIIDFLGAAGETYDAICLDVDNGPGWLTVQGNRRLYDPAGLRALRSRLTGSGVLTVWSAGPEARFAARLRRVFGEVDRVHVDETDPWGRSRSAIIYRAAGCATRGAGLLQPGRGDAPGLAPL